MSYTFDMKKLAKEMTREEFLDWAGKEPWCISKYGLDRSCCRDKKKDETCADCIKKAVSKIKFNGEEEKTKDEVKISNSTYKRLTRRNTHGVALVNNKNIERVDCVGNADVIASLTSRLADYEDTGLSPEQIKSMLEQIKNGKQCYIKIL